MNIGSSFRRLGLFLLLLVAGVGAAHAQATRTWVSGVGDDVNPCSRTAPCKTFAGAISKTAAGGVISVLDPGGFGAVTITKSITLEADGDLGSILASNTTGVIINITDTVANPTPTVVLRGLSIDGTGAGAQPTGIDGVRFLAGARLVVDRCTILNFTQNGIKMANTTGTAELVVTNTTINRALGSAVLISPTSPATASAALTDARLVNSGFGLQVNNGFASITKSVVSGNSTTGVKATGSNSITSRISLDDTLVSDNPTIGVNAQGTLGQVFFSRSTITNNGTGVSVALNGSTTSFGNNRIFGNVTNGTPTSTTPEQ